MGQIAPGITFNIYDSVGQSCYRMYALLVDIIHEIGNAAPKLFSCPGNTRGSST